MVRSKLPQELARGNLFGQLFSGNGFFGFIFSSGLQNTISRQQILVWKSRQTHHVFSISIQWNSSLSSTTGTFYNSNLILHAKESHKVNLQLLPVLNVLNLALPRESDWEAARDAIIEVVDMEKKLESLPGLSNHPLLQHISSTHRKWVTKIFLSRVWSVIA